MSIFSKSVRPKVNFSNFPLNESQLLTCNFGQLVPCYIREVVPNDRFRINGAANINFAPMIAPMMHDVHVSFHFFFVPNRIVYKDWETFITGSRDGRVLSEEEVPQAPFMDCRNFLGSSNSNRLLDYLGFPPLSQLGSSQECKVSSIPVLDYIHIWYQFYRDENLQIDGLSGTDTINYWEIFEALYNDADLFGTYSYSDQKASGFNTFDLKYRAFKKDYFTACLPSAQKGAPVTIGLIGNAPIKIDGTSAYLGDEFGHDADSMSLIWTGPVSSQHDPKISPNGPSVATNYSALLDNNNGMRTTGLAFTELSNLYADLSQSSAITINALREAIAVQEILESINQGGSRYNEFLLGNFGTSPSDYRLQRPEFLGGFTLPVNVQTVLQNAGYDGNNQTAYAAGRAIATGANSILTHTFQEHGFIMGIMSVMPAAAYYQGLAKHWKRFHRYDYYMPQMANLGEQAVTVSELYFQNNDQYDDRVFGYIPRWAEYKTSFNGIHGDFRGNLDFYHMYRKFTSIPTLSEAFISTKDIQPRPFAYWETENPGSDLIWAELFFNVMASRPMPYHVTPKMSHQC